MDQPTCEQKGNKKSPRSSSSHHAPYSVSFSPALWLLLVLGSSIMIHCRLLTDFQRGQQPALNPVPHVKSKHHHQQQHKVAWMVEGPAKYAPIWQHRMAHLHNFVLLYHSFDEDCKGCIFNPHTTISSGKNLLLREALKVAHQQEDNVSHWNDTKTSSIQQATADNGVYYYVYCDYDLEIECDRQYDNYNDVGNDDPSDACWRSYVSFLQEPSTTYPVHMPQTWFDARAGDSNTSTFQSCVDGAIKAVRFDFVPMFWPHTTSHDATALNLNDEVWWHITHRCFPFLIYTDGRWRVDNPIHSDYPHQYGKKGAPALFEMLTNEYPNLGGFPWDKRSILRHREMNHRCEVLPDDGASGDGASQPPPPPPEIYTRCQESFSNRFNDWYAKRGKYKDDVF